MAKNDFKAFATSDDANVISQDDYDALAARSSGFQSGVAKSAQLNKVWRQSSIMAAVLAQFITDRAGQDAIDDGSTDTLSANLKTAVFNDTVLTGAPTATTADAGDKSTRIATTEFVQVEGDARYARVKGDVAEAFRVAPVTESRYAAQFGQLLANQSTTGHVEVSIISNGSLKNLIIQFGQAPSAKCNFNAFPNYIPK